MAQALAYPYAQALFSLSKEQHNQDYWLEILRNLSHLSQHADFITLLTNPKINNIQLLELIIDLLAEEIPKQVINFLQLLIINERLLISQQIYTCLYNMILKDQQRLIAIVESAYQLSDLDQHDLIKSLTNKFAKTIELKVVVNPQLLAGIKITIDDKVIDKTVKGRLTDLVTQLKK